jgi:hypothetical protein
MWFHNGEETIRKVDQANQVQQQDGKANGDEDDDDGGVGNGVAKE